MLDAIVTLGSLAFLAGIIGLIVSIRKPMSRRPWIILLVAGFVVVGIFTGINSLTSDSDEEIVEEAAEQAATQNTVSWSVKEYTDLDVTVVSGDNKSVTLRFENNKSGDNEYLYLQTVKIGNSMYSINNGVNGFEGIPLGVKYNGETKAYFWPEYSASKGKSYTVEYYMLDGSDLPDSFVIIVDETEQYNRSNGSVDVYTFRDLSITLTRS